MAFIDAFKPHAHTLWDKEIKDLQDRVDRVDGMMRKDSDPISDIASSAKSIGHIIEIENGYLVIVRGAPAQNWNPITLYVASLDKLGEVLTAHKVKEKLLNQPQTVRNY